MGASCPAPLASCRSQSGTAWLGGFLDLIRSARSQVTEQFGCLNRCASASRLLGAQQRFKILPTVIETDNDHRYVLDYERYRYAMSMSKRSQT